MKSRPRSQLEAPPAGERVEVRRQLRPGDIGAIAALHGRVYARDHGLDLRFEAEVAEPLAAAVGRGFPGEREGVWVVEIGGEPAGSLALTDEGGGEGRVRFFLLAPALRGAGLGRRLLGELVGEARRAGYARLTLGTFSELRAAASLYRALGFELVDSRRSSRWGREITYQTYELALGAPSAP